MKSGKALFAVVLCLALAISFQAGCEQPAVPESALIEQIVTSYASSGEKDVQGLAQLSVYYPAAGDQWGRIMELWETPLTISSMLPEGLPEDDSLCIVVLGYQLNPDGTMREELIGRLEVALTASKQYPHAMIACTGGGTAAGDPAATEAGKMAEWLMAQHVEPDRLIVEDRSMTTVQNAVFTLDLLGESYPNINTIVIVTSDYHIEAGCILFGAEAILRNLDIIVGGNAAYDAPKGSFSRMALAHALMRLPRETAARETGIPDPAGR